VKVGAGAEPQNDPKIQSTVEFADGEYECPMLVVVTFNVTADAVAADTKIANAVSVLYMCSKVEVYKSAHAASGFAKRPLMLFAGLVCGNEWVGWFPLTEGAGELSGLLRQFLGCGVGLRGLTFELSGRRRHGVLDSKRKMGRRPSA